MGHLRTPRAVSPIVTLLAGRTEWLDAARAPLERLFGPAALQSEDYPFAKTSYYTPAMGDGLMRRFYYFDRRFDPGLLADWKLACNELEVDLAQQLRAAGGDSVPSRPVNIDPGYMEGSKLVLASTKDFAHRIYLRDGIFAEITVGYRENRWEHHYFTFPDFRAGTYYPFLTKARALHVKRDTPRRPRKTKS